MTGMRRADPRGDGSRPTRAAVPVVLAGLLVVACGGPVETTVVRPPRTTTTVAPTTTTTLAPTTTTVDVGSLPQTDLVPSPTAPAFQAAMQTLFAAVVSGSPSGAQAAFFPEGAYLQLKDIADAAGDYADRLVGEYDLDIMAAHDQLGPWAPGSILMSVEVPMQYAHWIPPGVCDNGVGYYEVANARVVYSAAGVTRSFGIASLISWRGEWYVVHLGAILRDGTGGTVLEPATGTGVSEPSTTC
jgi:hypothetical protein